MKLLLPSVVIFFEKKRTKFVGSGTWTNTRSEYKERASSRLCSSSYRGPSLLVFVIPSWLFSSNNTKRWVVCPLIPLCQPNFCLCVCVCLFVPGARAHSPRLSESIKKENIYSIEARGALWSRYRIFCAPTVCSFSCGNIGRLDCALVKLHIRVCVFVLFWLVLLLLYILLYV